MNLFTPERLSHESSFDTRVRRRQANAWSPMGPGNVVFKQSMANPHRRKRRALIKAVGFRQFKKLFRSTKA